MKILEGQGCIGEFADEWGDFVKCINNMNMIQTRSVSGPSSIAKVGKKLEITLGSDID
jgi:hypothetical protein